MNRSARRVALALSVFMSVPLAMAAAEPVAPEDRIPIDLRRTTLVVSDIDASLAFYRDALGLKVIYDNPIRTPRDAASDDEAERASRLVFLRANDDFIGIIGLLQYIKPEKPVRPRAPTPFSIGDTVLLFNASDLDARFAAAAAVPGVTVLSEPEEVTFPSYDGTGSIPVRMSTLIDPDGYIVELNQLLVDDLD